jgi:N-acetylmuramoyl-L-alanine amidase
VRLLLASLLWAFAVLCAAGENPLQVDNVRLWAAPDNTRVVFDVSGTADHKLFTLHDPERLVVDLTNARLGGGFDRLAASGGLVKGLRTGLRNGRDLRLVLDLNGRARPKSFALKPNDQYGHRLVIDLHPLDSAAQAAQPARPARSAANAPRDLVIAIDAGHGGEDPGARGPGGTREKDVVLVIARRLARLVDQEPGMRAVMIRDGDYYVGLRGRMKRAREAKADLFVSIHADAFKDRRVHGSSVYVLSQRGASSEMARWVAARENASDLVGGVSLDDKDDLLAEVLLDLSQTATIEASMEVADNVLKELKGLGKVHKRHVQHAAFVVLKSPDIPSILVETAFISNPKEERRLRDPRHQQSLAEAILDGLRGYFADNPPPGTRVAKAGGIRRHVVRRGDTLSHIAQRYGVGVSKLRAANDIRGDRLLVGKTLLIPAAGG